MMLSQMPDIPWKTDACEDMVQPYWLEDSCARLSARDADLAYDCSREACRTIFSHSPFARFKEEGKTLIAMFRDYRQGLYDRIPWGSIAMIAFTLLYIVNPVDFIPDMAPAVGFIDDAGLLGICLKSVAGDLEDYRCWTSSFYYQYLQRKLRPPVALNVR